MLLGRAIARRAATRDVARSFASQVARARSLAQARRDRPSCATNPATRTGSSRHWACYVTPGSLRMPRSSMISSRRALHLGQVALAGAVERGIGELFDENVRLSVGD